MCLRKWLSGCRVFLILPVLYCFLLTGPLLSQNDRIYHSIAIIGNIRDIRDASAYSKSLDALLDSLDHNHTILLNGDVSSADGRYPDVNNLTAFIRNLRDPGKRRIVILPGDRDWSDSGPQGWENVRQVEKIVEPLMSSDVLWPLKNGCPGPERISLDLTLNLLVINTQWWNHPYAKPIPATAECNQSTRAEVIEELKDLIDDSEYGNLVIAGHYPVESNGIYGGRFPVHKWLIPVPIISTMQTAYKQNIGGPREIINEEFISYTEDIEDLLKEYNSLHYVSGHEFNKEITTYAQNVLVNSGAPDRGGYVARRKETLYADKDPGIILLSFDSEGNSWATIFRYIGGKFIFGEHIQTLQAPCMVPQDEIAINERLVPCLDDSHVLTTMEFEYPDSVDVVANPTYEATGFHRMLLGKHYRPEWTSEVRVPVLDLDSAKGGLRPYAVGGGRQTTSLKFIGDNGLDYVFRSIDKDPSKALSYDLRGSLISLAVRDQTTTQHPYGNVVASAMLDHLDILHPEPAVYVMPDDPKLGPFRPVFGNLLGSLEEFPTGRKEVNKTFEDADEISRSVNMFRQLFLSDSNSIATDEYVRARMFDILIGDWGRHEDNWKWAGYLRDSGMVYRPIPRDRDHAFSRWDGVLPWLADRRWAKPSGENFDYKIRDIRSLTWQARHSDRFLLSDVTPAQWVAQAAIIQEKLTDSIIDVALEQLPDGSDPEIADEIAAKLKARRDDLINYAHEYSDLLSTHVDVVGTVGDEKFEVARMRDGSVRVDVHDTGAPFPGKLLYSRLFDPEITKEIRLFGVPGNDSILISGDVHRSILVRVIPGTGNDVVIDRSNVRSGAKKTHLYTREPKDLSWGEKELKYVNIPNDDAYRYDRTAFEYNTYLPLAYAYYTGDDGLLIGGGVRFTRYNYNKPGISAEHSLLGQVSTFGNFQFSYSGTVHHVAAGWDLIVNAEASRDKRFNYFFGVGNDTEYNNDSLRNGYYTLQNSRVLGEVGLRRIFWKQSKVAFIANVSSNSGEKRDDNIFEGNLPDAVGGTPLRIAKFSAIMDLDFRDQAFLPTRGMRAYAEAWWSEVLNEASSYGLFKGFMEWYGTARPFTLGLRAGGWVHEDVPPYYELEYLGQNTFLRGYRKRRFAGKKAAFFNSNLRIQLVDNPHWLVPHKIGINLFYDAGRVFVPEEESSTWHQGYGFGVYIVPIRERYTLAFSIAFSDEEKGLFRFLFSKAF